MNSNTDILFTRRSIRKYKKDHHISDELVKFIHDAAMCAPSARNRQPWHFMITRQRDKLDSLAELHPYGKMLKDATMAVLVCGDINLEDRESYIVQDCSAATQNLLLAAHGVGLGGVWLGVYPRKERIEAMREIFQYPDNIIPVSLVSLGFPDEDKPRNSNFNPKRIHLEKWNETWED